MEAWSPEQWLDNLLTRMNLQAIEAMVYEDYYAGRHPLQFATSKFREAFGGMFGAFSDNWCQIVVDSSVERLRVTGFQVNGSPSQDAWRIWQENGLDVESVVAHTEVGKLGRAFLLVDPNDGDPVITVEHPSQMVVVTDPANRRERLAACKRWLGEDGYLYATLYLEDLILKYESEAPLDWDVRKDLTWVPRTTEEPAIPNELGEVPVIPIENKPGLLGQVHSDLEPAVPLQNAVNKLCTDLIITSEYGAFPQRVVTGVEVPKDPTTGQPLAAAEMKAAMSRLWTFKPPDANVTSLPAADLSQFVNSIEMFVTHLAAQTRTPAHYLLAKLVNLSGDALTAAEAGLVSKCRQKILFYSDPWEEAIALALNARNGGELVHADMEALWADPERIPIGAKTDAAVKKKTLGVPLEVIWAELGYTPEQIDEMKKLEQQAAEQALEARASLEAIAARETITAPAPGVPGATISGSAPAPPRAPGQPPPNPIP